MGRIVVAGLFAVLFVIQAASLVPAYERSRMRIAEVVYRAPDPLLASALDAMEMRAILERVMRAHNVRRADTPANISVSVDALTVEFGLFDGDVRGIAADFGQQVGAASLNKLSSGVYAVLCGSAAQRLSFGGCTCSPANAPGGPATSNSASLPESARFGIARLSESRLPWLRPVDVLAMLIYVAAIFVWRRGDRQHATGSVASRQAGVE